MGLSQVCCYQALKFMFEGFSTLVVHQAPCASSFEIVDCCRLLPYCYGVSAFEWCPIVLLLLTLCKFLLYYQASSAYATSCPAFASDSSGALFVAQLAQFMLVSLLFLLL